MNIIWTRKKFMKIKMKINTISKALMNKMVPNIMSLKISKIGTKTY